MYFAHSNTDTKNFAAACSIVRALRAQGHEAWLAGGCVRDLLLGHAPKDYDIATSATPDIVLDLFPRTFAVGAHFGVVLVATDVDRATDLEAATPEREPQDPVPQAPEPQESGTDSLDESPRFVLIEVATFRSDGVYSDGRHPDRVHYTLSAEEDVRRRDFTINGLLLDPFKLLQAAEIEGDGRKPHPREGTEVRDKVRTLQMAHQIPDLDFVQAQYQTDLRSAVVDYVGGVADLDAGIVRAIGNPAQRFAEDHLRMLRAVRFAARFNFQIDPATHAAIRASSSKIHAVSRERVRDELTRMLMEGHARRAFELLDETGLLAEVLPEIARMKGVEQPPQYHPEGDVFTHTMLLLDQLEPDCSLTLAWGALLHDVGKPATFRRAERIRFDGHVEMGVAIGAEICRRFRFSNDETAQILALIHHHMRFADAPRMKISTLKRFFRLNDFEQHLALHRMDCMAGAGNLDHWTFVREQHATMPVEAVRPASLITGRELIAAGYTPGVLFKEMLHTIEEAQLEGAITTTAEAMELVRSRFPRE